MSDFVTLTDSRGEDTIVHREVVVAVWEDHCTEGNPPKIVHGSRILLRTGGSIFVRERAAEVGRLLAEVVP